MVKYVEAGEIGNVLYECLCIKDFMWKWFLKAKKWILRNLSKIYHRAEQCEFWRYVVYFKNHFYRLVTGLTL
jgi:hypothetical protein